MYLGRTSHEGWHTSDHGIIPLVFLFTVNHHSAKELHTVVQGRILSQDRKAMVAVAGKERRAHPERVADENDMFSSLTKMYFRQFTDKSTRDGDLLQCLVFGPSRHRHRQSKKWPKPARFHMPITRLVDVDNGDEVESGIEVREM